MLRPRVNNRLSERHLLEVDETKRKIEGMRNRFAFWAGLILFVGALRANAAQIATVEDLVKDLTHAITQKDEEAFVNLICVDDMDEAGKTAAINGLREIMKWNDCTVDATLKLEELDEPSEVAGKKYGLNGDYRTTIQITAKGPPEKKRLIPAGLVFQKGYRLLLSAPLSKGTPFTFKQGCFYSPYPPMKVIGPNKALKPGDVMKDGWSGRFFLIP